MTLRRAQESGVTVIVSVSPQSRASLAEAYGLTPQQVRRATGIIIAVCVPPPPPSSTSRTLKRLAGRGFEAAEHCLQGSEELKQSADAAIIVATKRARDHCAHKAQPDHPANLPESASVEAGRRGEAAGGCGQVLRRLTGFFLRLGAAHVFDTSDSRDFSLLETAAEFVARYREARPAAAPHAGAPPRRLRTAALRSYQLLCAQHPVHCISSHQQRNPVTDRDQHGAARLE